MGEIPALKFLCCDITAIVGFAGEAPPSDLWESCKQSSGCNTMCATARFVLLEVKNTNATFIGNKFTTLFLCEVGWG